MSGNLKRGDLKNHKTKKTLIAALSILLERQKFTQITVSGLCEEVRISRVTFYAHFTDKYSLLEEWLKNIEAEITNNADSYEVIENNINDFVYCNSRILKNLMEDANSETVKLLCDFLLSLLDKFTDRTNKGQIDPKYIILSEFCGGGLMNYIKWQIDNRFPENLQMMNAYLYSIMLALLKWYRE